MELKSLKELPPLVSWSSNIITLVKQEQEKILLPTKPKATFQSRILVIHHPHSHSLLTLLLYDTWYSMIQNPLLYHWTIEQPHKPRLTFIINTNVIF